MRITLDVPTMTQNRPWSLAENADVLRALLDCLIACNLAVLKSNRFPSLYESGVIYGRTEVWDAIPALYSTKLIDADKGSKLYGRAYGDCKSLCAARIAELLAANIPAEPEFRYVPNQLGGFNYHILVRTATGNEDPSKKCGMGKNENSYFGNRRT